jgi:branched-subunit amino acid transport protein
MPRPQHLGRSGPVSDLLVIVVVGLGTFAMRAVFLVRRRDAAHEGADPMLALVAPAVLAAIMLPALLAPRGEVSPGDTGASLAAAVAVLVVWRRTRAFPLALLAGLAGWWLVLALVAAA